MWEISWNITNKNILLQVNHVGLCNKFVMSVPKTFRLEKRKKPHAVVQAAKHVAAAQRSA